MLTIVVPGIEEDLWDEEKEEFLSNTIEKEQTLRLEHSLMSISNWESKWKKSFFSNEEKTMEELVDYVRWMTIDKNIKSSVYDRLSTENMYAVEEYIKSSMTATTFPDRSKKQGRKRRITSELIYYWMFSLGIPKECEKWHLNRLITLIRVFDEENAPVKKRKPSDISRDYAKRNAERRKKWHTKG